MDSAIDDETGHIVLNSGQIYSVNSSAMHANQNGYLSNVAASIQAYDSTVSPPNHDITLNGSDGFDAEVNQDERHGLLIAPCELSNDQFVALNHILSNIAPGNEPKQTLTILHGGGGTGKSFVVRKLCDASNDRKYQVVSTCPTGAGACQLDNRRTFHSAFKWGTKTNHRISARAAAFLKLLFDPSVVLVVVDEMSMFKASFFVLLDRRLRELYNPDKPFGGKSVLLAGDFWQLRVVRGTSLCKMMYMQTKDPNLVRAKHLFGLFKVFKLRIQQRASSCTVQQNLLEKFRMLPNQYPRSNRWTKEDAAFRPIDQEIVEAITKPLTKEDIKDHDGWILDSTIIVTSNIDRAVLNTCMAKVLATKLQTLLFRWRKPLTTTIPKCFEELIYNENENPELFGYFFQGSPGQILDNANGNVSLGVANGSRCWLHSLGWDDKNLTVHALRLVDEALEKHQSVVELPFPPQFINVRLADRDGKPISSVNWPESMNLEFRGNDNNGNTNADDVVIPIGLVLSNANNYSIKLSNADGSSQQVIYSQHAVDLAMVLTVWKAQGSTFNRVILLLEGSQHAPGWEFEHVYVAVSRVKSADSIRCFPLSSLFKKSHLFLLRPNVFTIKWFMDIGEDGMWKASTLAEI